MLHTLEPRMNTDQKLVSDVVGAACLTASATP